MFRAVVRSCEVLAKYRDLIDPRVAGSYDDLKPLRYYLVPTPPQTLTTICSLISWNESPDIDQKSFVPLASFDTDWKVNMEYVDHTLLIYRLLNLLCSLMINVVTSPGDLPHMVNPARTDPDLFAARTLPGLTGKFVQCADDLITFFTVGGISWSNLDPVGRPLGSSGKYIRGIKLSGLVIEAERMASFFGRAFRKDQRERCVFYNVALLINF